MALLIWGAPRRSRFATGSAASLTLRAQRRERRASSCHFEDGSREMPRSEASLKGRQEKASNATLVHPSLPEAFQLCHVCGDDDPSNCYQCAWPHCLWAACVCGDGNGTAYR
jgi:hypothetical protein